VLGRVNIGCHHVESSRRENAEPEKGKEKKYNGNRNNKEKKTKNGAAVGGRVTGEGRKQMQVCYLLQYFLGVSAMYSPCIYGMRNNVSTASS
jgi:hypothetical protein